MWNNFEEKEMSAMNWRQQKCENMVKMCFFFDKRF